LNETDPISYDAHEMGSIIEDKKEETIEKSSNKDVQAIEQHQRLDMYRSNGVNFLDCMNQAVGSSNGADFLDPMNQAIGNSWSSRKQFQMQDI